MILVSPKTSQNITYPKFYPKTNDSHDSGQIPDAPNLRRRRRYPQDQKERNQLEPSKTFSAFGARPYDKKITMPAT